MQKSQEIRKKIVISAYCLCIGVNVCTMVVQGLSKDRVYDVKLYKYKICKFGVKYSYPLRKLREIFVVFLF